MKVLLVLFGIIFIPAISVYGQDTRPVEDKEAAYTRAITSRAEKIVVTLNIQDAAKAERVKNIIVAQYRSLNAIHTARNEQVAAAKTQQDKELAANQIKTLEEGATAELNKQHAYFISELARELTPEQISQVKDGMTYGVVPLTYNAYLDMLPKLTAEQKEQIMKWLVEAREYAMDAESSEKKHAWFGKYKGRINNYLSKAGYDLKKEGEEWEKRRNAAKNAAGY